MKTNLLVVLAAIVLASCSAPKYAYKFDYHDYNAGRKEKQAAKEVAGNPGPVALQPELLVAEADVKASQNAKEEIGSSTPKAAPLTLSKSERKVMVRNIKAAVKEIAKAKESVDVVQVDQASKAMDNDLKLTFVFLALSIAAAALTGLVNLLWIVSTAALIVAIIFFVKWVMKQ
jgi:uncharacterized membrane protein